MQLTQKQEALVEQYLRDLVRAMEPADEREADRVQAWARGRIEGALAQAGPAPRDADVAAAVGGMGPPEEALRLCRSRRPAPVARARRAGPEPRWLGVCAWLADQTALPPWALRLAAFLLGLLLGPLALALYGLCFIGLRVAGRIPGAPPVRWFRLAWHLASLAAVALMLHFGADYALRGMEYGMNVLLKRPMPELGEWGWFMAWRGRMLALCLLAALPAGLVGGLPAANGWDGTLRRLSQALVALYAVALCFGVASVIAGIAVSLAREFAG